MDPVDKPGHVCPWWLAYTFDNPLRRLFHSPETLLSPYVTPGMRVADIGCGMGYFTIGMAKLVGDGGRVFAVDLQERMLAITRKRARRAKIDGHIETRACLPDDVALPPALDFALAFWMVHEVPDRKRFFSQLAGILKPDGRLLVAEPRMHVKSQHFAAILDDARAVGWHPAERPHIRLSWSVLLEKNSAGG